MEKISQATVCLHNYLQLTENARYIPTGFVDSEDSSGHIVPGDWRNVIHEDEGGLANLNRTGGNRYTLRLETYFKDYFDSAEGQVP